MGSSKIPAGLLSTWSTEIDPARNMLARKVCSACDSCRSSRVKCTGGAPCQRCRQNSSHCNYSVSRRHGRIKANKGRPGHSAVPQGELLPKDSDISQPIFENTKRDADPLPRQTLISNQDLNTFNYDNIDVVNIQCQTGHSQDQSLGFSPSLPSIYVGIDVPSLEFPNQQVNFSANNFSNTAFSPFDNFTAAPSPSYNLADLEFGSSCDCLPRQLTSIGTLCALPQETATIGLDAILQLGRETAGHVDSFIKCTACSKTSTSFVLTAIIYQRLGMLFCSVARNGRVHLDTMPLRLSLGTYQLTEEDDLRHKKILVASAAKQVFSILQNFGGVVAEYRKLCEEQAGEGATTETGRTNLGWVDGTIVNWKKRLDIIIKAVESDDWGKT